MSTRLGRIFYDRTHRCELLHNAGRFT